MTSAVPAAHATDPFAPFDDLLANGHITPDEHRQQCASVARAIVGDATAAQERNHHYHPEATESSMNDKTKPSTLSALSESIALTRSIMIEQIRTLDAMVPTAVRLTIPGTGATTNAADLLNAAANAHLAGAAQTLSTLSDVAARVRSQWAAANGGAPSTPKSPNVIDAEVITDSAKETR